jgi:CRP-like cAMP-binding protein
VPKLSFAGPTTGNVFLDAMPSAAFAALRPSLERVHLERGHQVYAAGAIIDTVFFPIDSIISVVADMSDGKTAEIGLVGREGMSGYAIVLDQARSVHRCTVQVPDSAESIPIDNFRSALESVPELAAYCLRYTQATIVTIAQSAGCNSLHTIDQRCARWLLMAHDRVAEDLVLLTQDLLSQMLGVRRAGVTLAASALQESGFISYTRGQIVVLDRKGLESASCECYEAAERAWKTIMGYSISKTK